MKICFYSIEIKFNKIYKITKFTNYLQRFHVIVIGKNTSKYDIDNSEENIHLGVSLQ